MELWQIFACFTGKDDTAAAGGYRKMENDKAKVVYNVHPQSAYFRSCLDFD